MDLNDAVELETKLNNLGIQHAEWKAMANHLDRMTKVTLANQMVDIQGASVAEKEMRARASKQYLTHIEGLHEAEKKSYRFGALLETIRETIQNRRTIESSRRAEISLQR